MKIKAFLLIGFIALALCLPALAQGEGPTSQEALVLTDNQGRYVLGSHMDILEDPSTELTIKDVTSPEYAAQFIPSQENVPNYGYSDSAFWMRVRLHNVASLTNLWLLEVNFSNLNYVDFYLPTQGGDYTVKQSGAVRPFETRDIPYYHIVFEVPLSYQEEQTFYIRVKTGSSVTLGFTLWSPAAFALAKIQAMLVAGLFYGALLMVLCYHLFIYFSLRESNYFYFVLFLAGSILFFSSYEGLADQYLWPGWTQYKLLTLVITQACFFITALRFSDVFLELKKHAPLIHSFFYVVTGYWGLMILIVPFATYLLMSRLTAPAIFLTPAFIAAAGFYVWRTGYKPARFFLVSWLGFVLGIMTAELVRLGVLPSTPITERSYQVGLIWLVLLSSLALADRINLLKAETEDANLRLRQSETRLNQFLEAMPVGVMVYDIHHNPHFINEHARALLGGAGQEVQIDFSPSHRLEDMVAAIQLYRPGSEETYDPEQRPIARAIRGEDVEDLDIEVLVGKRRFPIDAWSRPIVDENNQVQYALLAFQDISQRKQTEAELNEYRQRLERLVEERTEQLRETNRQLEVENAERRRLENILRTRLEWLVVVNQVNQKVNDTSDLLEAYKTLTDRIKKLLGAADAFLADFNPQSNEIRLLAHTCHTLHHRDLAGSLIRLPDAIASEILTDYIKPIFIPRQQLGNLEGEASLHFCETDSQIIVLFRLFFQNDAAVLMGVEFNEAERFISVDELTLVETIGIDIHQLIEKAWLEEQTREIITTEERNWLARDLHDSVTQVLFAASLIAEVLPQIWQRDPQSGLVSLEDLRRMTHGALAEMRTMLLELRPTVIIKTPLGELLTQLTEAITSHTNLRFQLFIEQVPTLPEDVHVCFYRIAQESLNNVVKHAQASLVSVSLSATPKSSGPDQPWHAGVTLMVRDNGCGFIQRDTDGKQHLGLSIMRERAAAIQATLTVESIPGQGTTVMLAWQSPDELTE